FVPQSYLPKDLEKERFYFPTNRGYEKIVKQRLDAWIKIKSEKNKKK
ncbi:MAG: replication-associated recombination protein A, partial [Desulfobacteraceae bacterium]|nr:replication-associated recombination protein A [Desulfobacteraceae bacterium]